MLWLFVVEYTQTYHLLFILHYITIIYIHIKSYPHNCCSIYLYRNPQKPWIIFIPLHISSYMFTSTLDCGLARIQKPLGVPCAIEAEKVRAVFMANGEWRMARGQDDRNWQPRPHSMIWADKSQHGFLRIPTRASGTGHALLNRSRWSFVYQGEFENLLSIRSVFGRSYSDRRRQGLFAGYAHCYVSHMKVECTVLQGGTPTRQLSWFICPLEFYEKGRQILDDSCVSFQPTIVGLVLVSPK